MRTRVHYKNKVWEIVKVLVSNEENMERYEVKSGKKTIICKVDSYSGQVINESL